MILSPSPSFHLYVSLLCVLSLSVYIICNCVLSVYHFTFTRYSVLDGLSWLVAAQAYPALASIQVHTARFSFGADVVTACHF